MKGSVRASSSGQVVTTSYNRAPLLSTGTDHSPSGSNPPAGMCSQLPNMDAYGHIFTQIRIDDQTIIIMKVYVQLRSLYTLYVYRKSTYVQ